MQDHEKTLLQRISGSALTGSELVRAAQTALATGGHQPGAIDGLLGPNTWDAAARWVRARSRGGALPGTFVGAAKRLDDIDIPRIGAAIGVGEDEVHAVLDVETAGGGFDSRGRPAMLFEPHIFDRQLSGSKLTAARDAGLAYPRWGERPYPRDSYPRLVQAMEIDQEAALRSASWGLGQIMGFNAGAAGYASAEDMVNDFLDDEERHLEAMIRFIATNGLDDELRRHDWAGFARGYNGAGYRKNRYDEKLAAAYARWTRVPDTPWEAN